MQIYGYVWRGRPCNSSLFGFLCHFSQILRVQVWRCWEIGIFDAEIPFLKYNRPPFLIGGVGGNKFHHFFTVRKSSSSKP